LAIARDIGAPAEEARALEGSGHCHMRDGQTTEARALLQDALTIYQRIQVPAARQVRQALASMPG
jgi:Tfp pilus assembly protein PilF